MTPTILVTGARGQIGSDLIPALRGLHPTTQIIASGRRIETKKEIDQRSQRKGDSVRRMRPSFHGGVICDLLGYEVLDVTDNLHLQKIIEQYQVGTIYHLAGVLSAKGEQNRQRCWNVNVNGLKNILEAAKSYRLKVFWPSSIAVFGSHTPKLNTPQITIKDPSTMYGITKVTGELLCQYYAHQFGVDIRSLRLPGIISHKTPPGGGTTDFAIEIFTQAVQHHTYKCFVRPETHLPMMYVPDAIKAILQLMQAEPAAINFGSSYNIAAVSFSAAELVAEIQKHLPDFICYYQPDFRQAIADSWPSVIDDTQARQDWGWKHSYDLSAMVIDMLEHLSVRSSEFVVGAISPSETLGERESPPKEFLSN